MDFSTAKKALFIGALLLFLLPFIALAISIPAFFSPLGILSIFLQGHLYFATLALPFVSFILILIGLISLSGHYKRPSIMKNALFAAVIGLLGGVATIIATAASILSAPWREPSPLSLILAVVPPLATMWLFMITAAFFWRRAYTELAEASGVERFRTAANLIWIGAFLAVVVVGTFIAWVAYLLIALAAQQLPEPQKAAAPQQR